MSRERPLNSLRVGDVVVRRHRLLKTVGTVVRIDPVPGGPPRALVKWNHPDTLPNPSREDVETLERVERGSGAA
jgi:hypothetical protein